jgi:hypothetical protein
MAQHNTDYGLVYDDEGKICVTKRTDIIPFSGVTSYAVETATTNYLAPYAWEFDSEQTLFYPYVLASGKTWADCWDEKQKAYVGGHNLTCWVIHTRSIDLGSVQAAGTKITLSWKHKGYLLGIVLSHSLDSTTFTNWNSANTIEYKGDSSLDFWESDLRIHLKIDGKSTYPNPKQLFDRWYDVEITYTLPSDARYIRLNWNFWNAYQANGGLGVLGYIRQPQLEIKPFASSFVNGSRPNGKLVVEPEDLGFNPGIDDWVVSYRKYPIATHRNTLTGYNTSYIGSESNGYYFYWGKLNNANNFNIQVKYNDGTYANAGSPYFNPDNYFRHWHSEVVLKHEGVMEYWVDGVLQCQLTFTKSLPNYGTRGFLLGYYWPENSCNSLFTNITYGKYTDQWTPEYIQRISAMTSTFYVPTKRVIV